MPNTATADEQLALALAGGATVEAAAEAAKLSVRTAYRRLQDEDFRRKVAEARAQMLAEVSGRLTSLAGKAVVALERAVELPPSALTVRAATAILQHAVALRSGGDAERVLFEVREELQRQRR